MNAVNTGMNNNNNEKVKHPNEEPQTSHHSEQQGYYVDKIRSSENGIETNRILNYWELEEDGLKLHFVAGACTKCHKIPSTHGRMKACSQCCLVWYCGKECQKKDWKYHKELCKTTRAEAAKYNASYIMETVKKALVSGRDFDELFQAITYYVKEGLNRDLDDLERQIINFPKICEICKDGDPAVLIACEICNMVFYCSQKHANQDSVRHKKFCQEYLLTLQCYHLITTKGLPIPRNIYFRNSTVCEYKRMTGTMKDYIRPNFDAVDAFVSEYISYPLSLLYVLEHTGLKNKTKKVSEMKELTVLMCDPCNSTHATMCHNYMWEYWFHLLPKLKKFNLILCELTPQPFLRGCPCTITYNPCKPLDEYMCSDCKSRECDVNVYSIDDYHKYKLSEQFKKPDVIYNHIITEINQTDLPYAEPEVPLVLLNIRKENIEKSLQVMKKNEKLDILFPLQLNPFRGIRPLKTQKSRTSGSPEYANSYIVGLRRKVKGKSK